MYLPLIYYKPNGWLSKGRPEFSNETLHEPHLWCPKSPERHRHDLIIELLLYFQHLLWCWAGGLETEAKTLLCPLDSCFPLLPGLTMTVEMMLHAIRRNCRWSCSETPLVDTLANLQSRNYKGCSWLHLCPHFCIVHVLRNISDYEHGIQEKARLQNKLVIRLSYLQKKTYIFFSVQSVHYLFVGGCCCCYGGVLWFFQHTKFWTWLKLHFSFSHFYCNDEFYGKATKQSKRKQTLDEVLLYMEFHLWPDEIDGPACGSCITLPS